MLDRLSLQSLFELRIPVRLRRGVCQEMLEEIEILNLKVDNLISTLKFIFQKGSESKNLELFSLFLESNLGKNKLVKFWIE